MRAAPLSSTSPPFLAQVPDVEQFMATYNMQCPMAAKRLIHSGMPATIEHNIRPARDSTASTAIAVAETVQHFITAMDSLKLNMVAVDQIYPLLSDLVQAMMKVGTAKGVCPG
jgi:ESCRT-I complex subunit VPS28